MVPHKILLIEDEFLIAKTTCLLLNNKGITAVHADTGAKGIGMVLQEKPDLILLDMMLPDMDGIEVLRRLKSDTATKEIPVILFTAADHEVSESIVRKEGAAGVLHKPFYPHQLFDIITTM
jgi:two-component system alkaline phosphatase synthesis response regulator PhoP